MKNGRVAWALPQFSIGLGAWRFTFFPPDTLNAPHFGCDALETQSCYGSSLDVTLFIIVRATPLRTNYQSRSKSVSEIITFTECGIPNLFTYPFFGVVPVVLIVLH